MRRRRSNWIAPLITIAAAALPAGCDRSDEPGGARPPPSAYARVEPPKVKPDWSCAPGLAEQYPDVAAFMQGFLETCLAGDYPGYRRLVSSTHMPESQQRFEKVYHGLKSLRIERIEEVDVPGLPRPTYLVVSRVEFRPDAKPITKRPHNQIAILVLREQGEWRMLPAPRGLQPEREGATSEPSTAPAEPVPDYPWEEEGG